MTRHSLAFSAACLALVTLPTSALSQSSQVYTQWDGVYTDAQATRGRFAYARLCATCHGSDLQGLLRQTYYPGQAPTTPPLVGDQFRANWDQLTLGDLFERIRVSMPQNAPGTLPSASVADILAFVLQSGGWPSGATELPSRATQLATIQFRASRP